MTLWNAFFLGMMVAWSPAMIVIAILLMRAREDKHHG